MVEKSHPNPEVEVETEVETEFQFSSAISTETIPYYIGKSNYKHPVNKMSPNQVLHVLLQ